MNNSNYIIGNRILSLPACAAESQPTAPTIVYLLMYCSMVCHVVGRKFAYRFRKEGTEYSICTEEVGHKNMLEKIAHIWELHDMYFMVCTS